MDNAQLWTALQYVEQNPVRADLVEAAEAFHWSSAASHLSGKHKTKLLDIEFWRLAGRPPPGHYLRR